ncbi:MAG: STAS domain-containing protein [Planctomycetaceae bacterium]|nr:STAS domain-containing protein [Planctomycetaceae bacterium]
MIDYQITRVGENPEILVMSLSGKLDNSSADFFFNCLEGEIDDGYHYIVVDCEELEFISSLGIGMLLRIQSRLSHRGGVVKLASVHGIVATVLHSVRLDQLFNMYGSVDEAVHSFAQTASP